MRAGRGWCRADSATARVVERAQRGAFSASSRQAFVQEKLAVGGGGVEVGDEHEALLDSAEGGEEAKVTTSRGMGDSGGGRKLKVEREGAVVTGRALAAVCVGRSLGF